MIEKKRFSKNGILLPNGPKNQSPNSINRIIDFELRTKLCFFLLKYISTHLQMYQSMQRQTYMLGVLKCQKCILNAITYKWR